MTEQQLSPPTAAQLQGMRGIERREALETLVETELRGVLFMETDEDLPMDDNFFELGLTSLRLVEVKERLEALTGCEIDAASMFSNPTAERLIGHLDERLAAG